MSSPVRLTSPSSGCPTFGIIVERAGQSRAEGRQVRAAVALRDVVREAEDVLVIEVVPLERDVDADLVALPRMTEIGSGTAASWRDRDISRRPRCRPRNASARPSFLVMARPARTRRTPELRKASSRKRCSRPLEVEIGDLERLGLGRKVTLVPLLPSGLPTTFSGASASPWRKPHVMLLAVAPDGQLEPFGARSRPTRRRRGGRRTPCRHCRPKCSRTYRRREAGS